VHSSSLYLFPPPFSLLPFSILDSESGIQSIVVHTQVKDAELFMVVPILNFQGMLKWLYFVKGEREASAFLCSSFYYVFILFFFLSLRLMSLEHLGVIAARLRKDSSAPRSEQENEQLVDIIAQVMELKMEANSPSPTALLKMVGFGELMMVLLSDCSLDIMGIGNAGILYKG